MTWLAVGALAVGCGSGPGAAVDAPDLNEEPPASADDPPTSSADAPPASADDPPPSSADAPGGTDGSPGGGGTPEQLCEAICDSLIDVDCSSRQDPVSLVIAAACEQGCTLDPEDRPCEPQITRLLQCFSALSGLCTDQVSGNACEGDLSAVATCQDEQDPDDGPGPGPGPGGDTCNTDGGCVCESTCDSCRCALPGAAGEQTCAALCG